MTIDHETTFHLSLNKNNEIRLMFNSNGYLTVPIVSLIKHIIPSLLDE